MILYQELLKHIARVSMSYLIEITIITETYFTILEKRK
jgi:hypothetical protein